MLFLVFMGCCETQAQDPGYMSAAFACAIAGDGPSSGMLIHGNRLKKTRPRKSDQLSGGPHEEKISKQFQAKCASPKDLAEAVHIPLRCILSGPFLLDLAVKNISAARPEDLAEAVENIAAERLKHDKGMKRGSAARMRDKKRGKEAWQNLSSVANNITDLGDRLLIHSVSDATALNCYIPAVRKFRAFVEKYRLSDASPDSLDKAVLSYLGACCYNYDLHPHQGNLVVSALCYVWPEVSNIIPLSWRGTRGWSKLAVTLEGGPVAHERLAVMEEELWLHGCATAAEAGDAIVVAVDGYLREQDLFQLRVGDVIFDRGLLLSS